MISLRDVFQAERVALRAPRPSDATALVDIRTRSRDFLAPWFPAPTAAEFDVRSTRQRILKDRADFRADRHYKFCITLGPKGPVIGRVSLSQIFRGIFQNAYLGYSIDVDHARRGFTTEAVRLALDVAFGPLELHRVQAAIMPHNTPSLALARKVGFRQEGRAERYLEIAGEWQDHLLFAITAEEWTGEAPIKV